MSAGPDGARAVAARLRETLAATLRAALSEDAPPPFALLDFPHYANAGDSAIWLGARAVLRALGLPEPVYTCDQRTWQPRVLARRLRGGTVLLSGGGNFGDAFPAHQRLREEVVRAFPSNRVVQLPQTIRYGSPEAARASRETLARHPRLTLLVRDEPSRTLAARDLGLRSVLCPDLAFGIPPPPAPTPRDPRILWLSREDAWRRHGPVAADDVRVADWAHEPRTRRKRRFRRLSRLVRHGLPLRAALSRTYDPLAEERVESAFALLAAHPVVVTDRLHGHILCLLLGRPHVLLDEADGKIRAFREAWTRDVAGVCWAGGPAEALAAARAMRDGTRGP